jgi:large subunit ribosomal protein L17
MKHKIGFNKLNRTPAHRKAMLRNMATVLFKHERIVTTRAKAVECRREAEKMITRAKEDSVHNRREIAKSITDEAILAKLFTVIGPRMKERNGGYTRIMRIGMRKQDAADMVVLELVDHAEDGKKAEREKRRAEKKAKAKSKAAAADKA